MSETRTTKRGVRLNLPDDYVLAPTEQVADEFISQGVLTPGMDQYGGADISTAISGDGTEYVAFCAKKLSTGVFGFYIVDVTHGNSEVPYAPFCTGRGEINNAGRWIAWRDKDYFRGMIPGFVGYPNVNARLDAIEQRVLMLEQQVNGMSQKLVAMDGAIAQLTARVTALEARPSGGAGGGLSESDRQLLQQVADRLQQIISRP